MRKKRVSLGEDLLRLLPLTPAVFFVLFALSEGEKHGYAIMREIKVLSEGRVTMGPGTLYTTIQRLLVAGAIQETTESGEERRRYYRLTPNGLALLKNDLAGLDSVLKLARTRNLLARTAQ
jgi:DNA-binding PadR family transcriptional regulator